MKPKFQYSDPKKGHEYFLAKMAFTTGPAELNRWMQEKELLNIVDVRRPDDYEKGHIPGAINLPREKWDHPEGLRNDTVNVVYCYTQQCHLAPEACLRFTEKGYPCMELEGGIEAWQKYKLPVQSLIHAWR